MENYENLGNDFWNDLENWMDDNDPHMSGISRSELVKTGYFKEYVNSYKRSEKTKSAKEAGAKAATTREKNAKLGINQKNLRGSTKQKKWASEIRGTFIQLYSESYPYAVRFAVDNSSSSKIWIENRNDLLSLVKKIDAALTEAGEASSALNAAFDAAGVGAGKGFNTADHPELLEPLRKQREANKALWSMLD